MINDDFFALQLMSGHLLFSYNLGSGQAEIRSAGSYNDGLLHRVSLLSALGKYHIHCPIGIDRCKFNAWVVQGR